MKCNKKANWNKTGSALIGRTTRRLALRTAVENGSLPDWYIEHNLRFTENFTFFLWNAFTEGNSSRNNSKVSTWKFPHTLPQFALWSANFLQHKLLQTGLPALISEHKAIPLSIYSRLWGEQFLFCFCLSSFNSPKRGRILEEEKTLPYLRNVLCIKMLFAAFIIALYWVNRSIMRPLVGSLGESLLALSWFVQTPRIASRSITGKLDEFLTTASL